MEVSVYTVLMSVREGRSKGRVVQCVTCAFCIHFALSCVIPLFKKEQLDLYGVCMLSLDIPMVQLCAYPDTQTRFGLTEAVFATWPCYCIWSSLLGSGALSQVIPYSMHPRNHQVTGQRASERRKIGGETAEKYHIPGEVSIYMADM